MTDLKIFGTTSAPTVNADSATGVLQMSGDSYPENSFEFFAPIIAWVEEYLESAEAPLRLELHLLYLNTSSVKAMMDIFDMLEEAHGNGKEVSVTWYYDPENERIADLADEFKEDCTFSFDIKRAEQ